MGENSWEVSDERSANSVQVLRDVNSRTLVDETIGRRAKFTLCTLGKNKLCI